MNKQIWVYSYIPQHLACMAQRRSPLDTHEINEWQLACLRSKYFCLLRNLGLCPRHCECHIMEILKSFIIHWTVIMIIKLTLAQWLTATKIFTISELHFIESSQWHHKVCFIAISFICVREQSSRKLKWTIKGHKGTWSTETKIIKLDIQHLSTEFFLL